MIRLKLTAPDHFPVMDPDGKLVGFVESVVRGGGRITARGWTIAEEAGLSSGSKARITTIADFAAQPPGAPDADPVQGSRKRFELSLRTPDRAASLYFRLSGTTHIVQLRF